MTELLLLRFGTVCSCSPLSYRSIWLIRVEIYVFIVGLLLDVFCVLAVVSPATVFVFVVYVFSEVCVFLLVGLLFVAFFGEK